MTSCIVQIEGKMINIAHAFLVQLGNTVIEYLRYMYLPQTFEK